MPVSSAALLPDAEKTGLHPGKRQQILDGAQTLFLNNGYEGTSMSQVAREAGVSKGTLYNYFDCKAALFSALVEQCAQAKILAIYGPLHADDLDCRTAMYRMADGFVRMLLEPITRMMYRVIVAEASKFPLLADIFWQRAFGIGIASLTDFIVERVRRGEIATDDPVFSAEQFAMLCQTRIIHRNRFELPVDTSDAAIDRVARSASDAFMKIHAVS